MDKNKYFISLANKIIKDGFYSYKSGFYSATIDLEKNISLKNKFLSYISSGTSEEIIKEVENLLKNHKISNSIEKNYKLKQLEEIQKDLLIQQNFSFTNKEKQKDNKYSGTVFPQIGEQDINNNLSFEKIKQILELFSGNLNLSGTLSGINTTTSFIQEQGEFNSQNNQNHSTFNITNEEKQHLLENRGYQEQQNNQYSTPIIQNISSQIPVGNYGGNSGAVSTSFTNNFEKEPGFFEETIGNDNSGNNYQENSFGNNSPEVRYINKPIKYISNINFEDVFDSNESNSFYPDENSSLPDEISNIGGDLSFGSETQGGQQTSEQTFDFDGSNYNNFEENNSIIDLDFNKTQEITFDENQRDTFGEINNIENQHKRQDKFKNGNAYLYQGFFSEEINNIPQKSGQLNKQPFANRPSGTFFGEEDNEQFNHQEYSSDFQETDKGGLFNFEDDKSMEIQDIGNIELGIEPGKETEVKKENTENLENHNDFGLAINNIHEEDKLDISISEIPEEKEFTFGKTDVGIDEFTKSITNSNKQKEEKFLKLEIRPAYLFLMGLIILGIIYIFGFTDTSELKNAFSIVLNSFK